MTLHLLVNTRERLALAATLEAGLAQIGASEPTKRVITGVVIVCAVMLDAWRRRASGV